MKSEKNLKIYSILFIVLGIIDIALLAFQTLDGHLANEVAMTGASIDIQNMAMTIVWVLVVIIALIKLYIGYRGLSYANGETEKTGFITFMKVVLGIEIVGIIVSFFGQNGTPWSNILTYAVNILIIAYFIKYASEIKNSKK